jgi:TetR/AcrR family transcriptional regulator, cholesterol catabolism regulator
MSGDHTGPPGPQAALAVDVERSDGSERTAGRRKPRPTRARRSVADDRWEVILNAAGRLFLEKGYAGATVQDVAGEAGMLSGSLYYYIDSKEDLLFALVERVHASGLLYLDDPGVREGDAISRLHRFIDLWGVRIERNRDWSLLVEREFRTLSDDRRQRILEQRAAYERVLRSIISDGVSEGVFEPSTDAVVATQVIFQMLNYTTLWFRPGGRLSFPEVIALEREFIIRGLSRAPAPIEKAPRRRAAAKAP